jgi:hypothetical protein
MFSSYFLNVSYLKLFLLSILQNIDIKSLMFQNTLKFFCKEDEIFHKICFILHYLLFFLIEVFRNT